MSRATTPAGPPAHGDARRWAAGALLVALPIVAVLVSLTLGNYDIGVGEVLGLVRARLTGGVTAADPIAAGLLWDVRLPRVLAAALIGAALAASGAVFQGVFRNPLAEPYTLGVSNGAGFGAALAILASLGSAATQASALAFGVAAAGLTFVLGARSGQRSVTLVLAGMLVASLFASLLALLKFLADPQEKLPQIVYWLMGSVSSVGLAQLGHILPVYLVSLALLLAYRWRLNLLAMGDTQARAYGVNVGRERTLVILACTALTAVSVSVAGIIGWVGVVVPHIARVLVGPDFRRLLPASVSLGAVCLVVVDDICRTISATEVPLGVVTGIVGAPLLMWFVFRGRVTW